MSARTWFSSLPRELLVQEIRGTPQFLGRVIALELHDAVLHVAAVDDHDREHAVVGQRQELDLAQRLVRLARNRHDAGQVRQRRQHLRGDGDERLRIAVLFLLEAAVQLVR